MRFWIPFDAANRAPIKVSIEGKPYDVVKDEKSNGRPLVVTSDLKSATVAHLVTMGWLFADSSTAQFAREESHIALGSDGQPKTDETLKKNSGIQA